MARIEIQKPEHTSTSSDGKRELYATVCYFYPQYTLKEVQNLPARDIHLLINIAQKYKSMDMYNLTNIAAAPHSKNGKSVKKLADHFKKIASS